MFHVFEFNFGVFRTFQEHTPCLDKPLQPLRGVGPSGCLHLSQAPAERRLRASICQAGLYHPGGTVDAASGTGVETTKSGSWTQWGFKRSTYYHGNPSHTHTYSVVFSLE